MAANTAWQNPAANFNFDTDVAGQTNAYFLPEVFSKKIQVAFRKSAVCQAITNTDYMGEIASYGDTVNIIKEPTISVSQYLRGTTSLSSTDLTDQELQLVVDQANYFQFEIDDLESRFSHINWQEIAADNAGYNLKDRMDSEVLEYMVSNVSTSSPDHVLGADASPAGPTGTGTALESITGAIDVGFGSNEYDPLTVMARMARLLDEANVPAEDRWLVASPDWYEVLASTSSKLMTTDYNAGLGSVRNGLVQEGKVRGFTMYVTNNMPTTTYAGGVVLAGHKSATATAEQLMKVETIRSTATFRDIVRGLHAYGRKVLRDNALVSAYYTID